MAIITILPKDRRLRRHSKMGESKNLSSHWVVKYTLIAPLASSE